MVHAKNETTSTKYLLRHLETNKYCEGALLKNSDDVIPLLDNKMMDNNVWELYSFVG